MKLLLLRSILFLCILASAFAQYDGTWTGTTGQGREVSFVVGGGTLTTFVFQVSIQGAGCTSTTTTTVTTSRSVASGTFVIQVTGGTSQTYISGIFSSSNTASGTLVYTSSPLPGTGGCAGTVATTWTATRSGGGLPGNYDGSWNGTTAQGLNISFTVAGGYLSVLSFQVQVQGFGCNSTFSTTLPLSTLASGGSFLVTQNTATAQINITGTFTSASSAGGTITYTALSGTSCPGTTSTAWSATKGATASGVRFVPMSPCRVIDTRSGQGVGGLFGPPTMQGGTEREFPMTVSGCAIPFGARAYSLNVTAVPTGPLGYLTVYPGGQARPTVSTLNSFDGSVVANAAIVPAGPNGEIRIFVSNTSDVVVDINGFFTATGDTASLYTVNPCRVVDTRAGQGTSGAFGPPSMTGGASRDFPFPNSVCGLPSWARAYSVNATVVPPGPLGYLTLWPTGQPQPFVSTLNSFQGKVVANAALVPAGTNGNVSAFVTNATDMILDVNGYFAAPGGANALSFFPVTPCRLADTRAGQGLTGVFGPPTMGGGAVRDFPVPAGSCGIPGTARAYSVNVTVVPPGPLSYLTLWPTGLPQPFVSTLNSFDGRVVANAAIVPAGNNGSVSVYVSNPSDVIIDINGYFAP